MTDENSARDAEGETNGIRVTPHTFELGFYDKCVCVFFTFGYLS